MIGAREQLGRMGGEALVGQARYHLGARLGEVVEPLGQVAEAEPAAAADLEAERQAQRCRRDRRTYSDRLREGIRLDDDRLPIRAGNAIDRIGRRLVDRRAANGARSIPFAPAWDVSNRR